MPLLDMELLDWTLTDIRYYAKVDHESYLKLKLNRLRILINKANDINRLDMEYEDYRDIETKMRYRQKAETVTLRELQILKEN